LLYAKNDRERLAAGVSMLFTLAGVGYGIYKVANLPSKAKGGNWLPASKEHMGTFLSEAEAAFRGEVVVAREVALQPSNGPAVRLDFVTRNLFGRLKGVESKFGPDARSTPNQRVSYPLLRANGGIVNAQNGGGAGWTQGMKIGPLEILVDWWSRRPPQDGSP
jgi:hypothetical protein